jgi:iron complex outermembrane receptor protein
LYLPRRVPNKIFLYLPVAIDVVSKKDIQDGLLQMQLPESLTRIPAITVQNRNNEA